MTDRLDIAGKLASVESWTVDEFSYFDDAMKALGAHPKIESGPGVAFRRGGKPILRLHPKRRYLAIGFPEVMRPDVEAMTQALRPQRGAAWVNYGPGVCDRDTIEALVNKSIALESKSLRASSGELPSAPTAAPDRPRDADHVDLALVLAVLRACKQHELATAPKTTKVLRETIYFYWEAPRLPVGGKYSPNLPHSPAARARRLQGARGGLVYEHVYPIGAVIRGLLADVPTDEAALRTVLESTSQRVVITQEENALLTAAGVRDAVPEPGDVWSRYRLVGLDPSSFVPLASSTKTDVLTSNLDS